MNLYKLHDNPKDLHKHKEADIHVVQHFWDKYLSDEVESKKKQLAKREDAIAKSAMHSFLYASEILRQPFPKGEAALTKNTDYAFMYAKYVLQGPFPKGEDAISKSGYYSFNYAMLTDKRFDKGEKSILSNGDQAVNYAAIFLNNRWPELEHVILAGKRPAVAVAYAQRVLKKPWPEAEPLINTSIGFRSAYLKIFPERKDALLKI